MTEADVRQLLGTDESGTPPEAMLRGLKQLGLAAQGVERMTMAQLTQAINAGHPVILCLQAYGSQQEMDATEAGHWCVASGVTPAGIELTDPAAGGSGKVVVSQGELMERWRDRDSEGRPYVRFGIIVSGKSDAATYAELARRLG
jgi:predicted double-glycine peptidase